ncbi:MAG: hypothetical protein AAFV77_05685 [Planctomycetota bacterium]
MAMKKGVTMTEEHSISDQLQHLVIESVGIALADLSETGQLLPFIVSVINGEKALHRCVAETFEEAEQKARKQTALERQKAERVVMIFDGIVNDDTTRYEAVIAEAFDGPEDSGVRFA